MQWPESFFGVCSGQALLIGLNWLHLRIWYLVNIYICDSNQAPQEQQQALKPI